MNRSFRNSWGTGWGEDGYIRLGMSPSHCTADNAPLDGLGCPGGPASVTVCGVCGIQYAPSIPVNVSLA